MEFVYRKILIEFAGNTIDWFNTIEKSIEDGKTTPDYLGKAIEIL